MGREMGTGSPRIVYYKPRPKPISQNKGAPRPVEALTWPNPFWLRDACNCELCVDPSSKQKHFQTSDIPLEIGYSSKEVGSDGTLSVTWSNDIPGFGSNHISTYSRDFLALYEKTVYEKAKHQAMMKRQFWNKDLITKSIKFVDFNQYMSKDSVLYDVLHQLYTYGLVFLRNAPESERAVEDIGGRIGTLKNTFYGLTWDVKSVPQAKNVAYTHQHLGLHMDLLYTADPPGLQLLHCLKNSCEGGTSLFSDSFHAAIQLRRENPDTFRCLNWQKTTFVYDNAGEFYEAARNVVKCVGNKIVEVNWSPPFQGPFVADRGILSKDNMSIFSSYARALKALAAHIEAPENLYEYRMKEGECVIFDNRRVLHGRGAFDISSGERWLKGAYLDADVFKSRHRVLHRTYGSAVASSPP